jgi:hypothetical protein
VTPAPTDLNPYGGAIHNLGVLTVEDCVFEGNQTTRSGNQEAHGGGGAIFSEGGVAIIRRSQFLFNHGGDGGAVYNLGGQMTISDSSFVANTASDQGVAIQNFRARLLISGSLFRQNQGGGMNGEMASVVFSETQAEGELVVANSTFAHNDTGFAGPLLAVASSGRASLVSSTFLNSSVANASTGFVPGAPAAPRGHFLLINSLLVNTQQRQACIGDAITDGGHNLQFPTGDCGPSIPVVDPLLDVWAEGSGPTLTISLAPGSPAIDAGDGLACADWPVLGLDARGRLRGGDGNGDGTPGCDIGAYEAGASITATPTQTPTAGPSPTPSVTRTPSITPTPSVTPTPTFGPSPTPTFSRAPPPRPTVGVTCTPPPCECGRIVGTCPSLRCLACTPTAAIPIGQTFLPIAER